MSNRSQARALTDMIKMNMTGAPHARQAVRSSVSDDMKRTTFSAPTSVIQELRQLALLDRCTMNDLILIAVQDLLRSIGRDSEIAVSPVVRERIEARRRPAGSDAD